ncbi:MAG: response regulator PleD [Syntrophorhabdaceae bacterium PtaU1.Bin034]|nr:MAG: response regulator PleD [Syntrophorhabdaceae bacterium PtaU1.Bin034]
MTRRRNCPSDLKTGAMKTAVLVSRDTVLIPVAERLLEPVCRIVPFSSIRSALDYIYSVVPDLLIIDMALADETSISILNAVKSDPIFTHLPVLAVVDDGFMPDWKSILIEDFIWKSDIEQDFVARAELCILRSERIVEVNPLTRLPGNISINRTIQNRIDSGAIFALAYADLDNFKPFNDHYGFSRGDEVIKMTGRLILNVVKNSQPEGSFVGHIGGDDFTFIMDEDKVEKTASEIVSAFDRIIFTFYDVKDREAGNITACDRQGNISSYPLVSISIGITSNRNRRFSHYGQMTEAVSEMKQYAKRHEGSCYKSDKRNQPAGKK